MLSVGGRGTRQHLSVDPLRRVFQAHFPTIDATLEHEPENDRGPRKGLTTGTSHFEVASTPGIMFDRVPALVVLENGVVDTHELHVTLQRSRSCDATADLGICPRRARFSSL